MLESAPGWLCDEQETRQRLRAASKSSGVSLGVLVDGRTIIVSDEESHPQRGRVDSQLTQAGCLAKCVTATLVAAAVADGLLNWSDHVDRLLPLGAGERQKLSGVTVRQLLNHTHGLDASRMTHAPRTAGGRLDAASFCKQLGERRICAPGALYSYGNAGSWLAGMLLEHVHEKPYAQLLGAVWENFTNARRAVIEPCPSTGGPLGFTNAQWLYFMRMHCECSDARRAASDIGGLEKLQLDQTALPGWHPTERAAALGWKVFRDGWYGHNSNLFDRTVLLRFSPARRVAIVLAAPGKSAFFVLGSLLGEYLGEFRGLRPPRQLPRAEAQALDLSKYIGRYSQAQVSIEICEDRQGGLSYVSRDRATALVRSRGSLQAARNELFLVQTQSGREFEFLQYLPALSPQVPATYLWDGKQLWPRTA